MRPTLIGFFDELEKIGSAERLLAKLLPTSLSNVQRLATIKGGGGRVSKGIERHKRMMEAVEHPYPASWVTLGMHPRD